ncbi:5-formyltetrahydrofolate cyclo-ligase [Kocuria coralli]|uniref:5-formyltetrahydrofolate cyclo-ligase n=1 Tax=Kocuria coralli TaxID=1461025 RepID=A0A5J5KVP9_9MICC|nr:5-formyltetrahydrofolate cyclo-ligase [Kocuria coralli]KAA9393654.1 5-formyltetrahydrofolate cyclo-ligase [Kocuria coralli]
MNVHPGTAAGKDDLRRRIRRARRELSAPFREQAAQGFRRALSGLAHEHPHGPILAFLPTAEEPGLEPGLRDLLGTREVWLPVTQPDRHLTWSRWEEGTGFRATGPGGLLEPEGDRVPAAIRPAFVLVPCLAVDGRGIRLGMGGGFYDTFLTGLDESVERVGCIFARELLPAGALPADPWDAAVHRVLTERGIQRPAA